MELIKKNKIEEILNDIILTIVCAYILEITLPYVRTSFVLNNSIESLIHLGLISTSIYQCYRCACKREFKRLATFLVIFLVCYISFNSVGYEFILWFSLVIISVSHIEYNKILTSFIITEGMLIATAIILALCNGTENIIYLSFNNIRSSWGIIYTTDLASIILFLSLALWAKIKKVNKLFSLLLAFLSMYISFSVTKSNTSGICSLMFCLAIIFDYIIDLKELNNKKIKKILNLILLAIFPVSALFIFVFIYMYHLEVPIAYSLDTFMHSRISLAHNAIHNYGIHPFGSEFRMIGFGTTSFAQEGSYNFIDCSYALILIRYGWVIFVLFFILWEYIIYRAIKTDNYRIAIAMSIIAFHSLSEHHLPEFNYDAFLMLPFANISQNSDQKDRIKDISIAVSLAIILGLLFISTPSLLMHMRTFISVHSFSEISKNIINTPMFIIAMSIITIILISYITYEIIYGFKKHNEVKKYIYMMIVVLSCSLGSYILSNQELKEFYRQYETILLEEENIISIINNSKKGSLYSSDKPLFYEWYFGDVANDIKQNEELADKENMTFIINSNFDSYIFRSFGYQWLEISSEHAIYTNDNSVINALTEDGYTLYNFNAHKNDVDLEYEASLNNVELIVSGFPINSNNNLLMGPYINLYYGNFILNYKLSDLSINQLNENNEIGKVVVKAYSGQQILAEKILYLSDFDENGNNTGFIEFASYNYMNIEFIFESIDGNGFTINEISYTRTS